MDTLRTKLLIYDNDGTLMPTKNILCTIEDKVLEAMGVKSRPWNDYLTSPYRVIDWHTYYIQLGIPKSRTQEAIDLFFKMESELEQIPVIDGSSMVLKFFNDIGIIQHMLTHNHYEDNVHGKLLKSGLSRYFNRDNVTVTSTGKKDSFKSILKQHNAAPEETVFVTDLRIDVEDGNANGIYTIAVANKHSFDTRAELSAGKPYRIIKDLRELIEFIRP